MGISSAPPVETFKTIYGQRKRSIALYGDKIYLRELGQLDRRRWTRDRQACLSQSRGNDSPHTNSCGPIIANGMVIAGSHRQRQGGGYVTGHDARNGEELWRNEMIPQPGEPGDETWAGTPSKTAG